MEKYDVIIVGGGPAGVSASIYTARALLKTLVIEKTAVGGQIALSDVIENYPGYPEPTNPTDLMNKMQKQAERFGVKFEFDEVKEIQKQENGFLVKTDWDEYFAKGIILSVGSSAKKTGVPGEEKFLGKGIAFCATCDAPFYKDKDIAVIGAGNSGIQEGLFALNFVRSITYVEYMPKINAEKILQEKIKEKKNVKFYLNTQLMEILGDEKLEGIRIKNRETGKEEIIKVDGVFLFVGITPNTGFLKDFIEIDERGYIITDHTKKTSVEGVYAAGDAVKNEYSQVVISAGSGVTAAMSLISYLENKK